MLMILSSLFNDECVSSKNTKPLLFDINAIPLIFKQIQSFFRGLYFLNIIWNETVITIHDWHDNENNNDNEIQQWK